MFRPLRQELLEGLEHIAVSAHDEQPIVRPYVAEVLEFRGLVTRDDGGGLALTAEGKRLLLEHHKRGLLRRKSRDF